MDKKKKNIRHARIIKLMHLTKAFKQLSHTHMFRHLFRRKTDKWGQLSISTCFSVNPKRAHFFSTTTQSPSCSCWQCLLFHVPLCTYVQSVSAHRCLSVCMGAFACVQICVRWVVLYMSFFFLPLTLNTHLSFQPTLHVCAYVCVCVYVCVPRVAEKAGRQRDLVGMCVSGLLETPLSWTAEAQGWWAATHSSAIRTSEVVGGLGC